MAYRSVDKIMEAIKNRIDVKDTEKLEEFRDYLIRKLTYHISRDEVIKEILKEHGSYQITVELEPKFIEDFLKTEYYTRSKLYVEIVLEFHSKIYLSVIIHEIKPNTPPSLLPPIPDVIL